MDAKRNSQQNSEPVGLPACHPSLRDLFIADEQPGEVDSATVAYLRAHPEIQQLINRQKNLERLVRHKKKVKWDTGLQDLEG